MVFSTPIFLFAFLPFTILLYYFSQEKLRNLILLAVSLIFYAWGEPYAVILMIFSITINYMFGLLVDKSTRPVLQKTVLILSVIANLGILIIFKYSSFIIINLNTLLSTNLPDPQIPLPIGISFFTFQAMSYVIDVYRKDGNVQKNYFSLALYISFFPQLIAGPIVRYKDIDNQIRNRSVNYRQMASGIQRFLIGLSKKVLISNVVGELVDNLFIVSMDYWTTGISWLVIICYTLQIYFDFSAYSDMAIGLGRMFGFEFLENFNYPYNATSIRDFWRKWHISLSTWFRDYLYIPLGGSRCATWRIYLNQLIVFFLCGLWHGSSWNFVIWGLIHGLFLVLERIGLGNFVNKLWKPLQHVYTLLIVMIGWVFFRAETLSSATQMLTIMFGSGAKLSGYNLSQYITPLLLIVIIIGVIISSGYPTKILDNLENKYKHTKNIHIIACFKIACLTILMILSFSSIASGAYNPFIYFRF
ncbi:MBOAT family O-acyltransferase [Diplocloster modestus]|uniref:MBOAT family protein n=1 Tax=Diplocloster modestus TaxID=2850322 RepID=A0ABS6K1A9_9FIRM|nr:MBOAT family O-acyltransferase [Diplocloster modestus]MBU9724633.1 MBOAT family protein [Diplocloster modestus]